MFEISKEVFSEYDCIDKIVAQSYDGAAVKSGQLIGLQAKIKEICKDVHSLLRPYIKSGSLTLHKQYFRMQMLFYDIFRDKHLLKKIDETKCSSGQNHKKKFQRQLQRGGNTMPALFMNIDTW